MRKMSQRLMGLVTVFATMLAVALPAQAATISPRIYYGEIVSAPNPYGWMTALLRPRLSDGFDAQFCGGSLIADDVVITAAHCVDTLEADEVQVAVGYLTLSSIASRDRQDVIEVIVHPEWDTDTNENDIALLILADGSENTDVDKVALVDDTTDVNAGVDVRALGWGELETSNYPDSLRTVDLDISASPGENCQSYGGAYDPVSMLCATATSGANFKDTCYGDSGGPLFTTTGSGYRLVGLTSWGYECGLEDYPGIYTRVSTYLDWISEETVETLTFNSFAPQSGAPGATVVIEGEALDTVTSVTFNGVAAAINSVTSARLTVTVPAGASTGDITITDGTDSLSGSRNFTVAYPTPKPSRVSPSSGTYETTVTITGKGFLGATGVRFGGVSATEFTVNSDTSITAKVPEGAATGSITVINPSKTGSGSRFTVTPPAGYPTITRVSTTSAAPGETITLTGTNFTGTTAVKFNGLNAASFSVASSTKITAVVPAGATSGVVSVTNALGTTSSSSSLSIKYSSPSIRSFSPGSASVGTTVTITGKNFTGITSVMFNGVEASSFTVVSATRITAVVPAGATRGKITVSNPSKSATSRSSLTIS